MKNRYHALRSRDFRFQLIGQFISNSGTQMQFVAVNWHIYLLTRSAFSLGIVGFTRFLPVIVFALIAGVVTDRFNRKKLLIITEIFLTILALVLAISTITGSVSPALIYIVSFLSASLIAFELPARQSFVPSLVPKKDLTNAWSLTNVAYNVSSVLGPALGGLFIASYGIAAAYFFNAISYIAIIAALLLMRSTGEISGVKAAASLTSIKEGLRFVFSKSMIWSTMILDFFSTFFAEGKVLLPIFAREILAAGPREIGFLYAAPFIGGMIAGGLVASLGRIREQGKVLLLCVTVYGIATIVFGLSRAFLLSFLALVAMGAGDGVSAIIRGTIRQLITPDSLRGRMTSINMIFFEGGPQLGEFEAGILAGLIGAPASVVIGGAGVVAVVIIMSLAVPRLRTYKDTHELFP